jgi:ribosome modulation factor
MDYAVFERIENLVREMPTRNEKIAYAIGYDCGMNGADEKNCHFSIFSSQENTKAWEAGKKQAEIDKAKK